MGSWGNVGAAIYRRVRLPTGERGETALPRDLYHDVKIHPRGKSGFGYDVRTDHRLRRLGAVRGGKGMSVRHYQTERRMGFGRKLIVERKSIFYNVLKNGKVSFLFS